MSPMIAVGTPLSGGFRAALCHVEAKRLSLPSTQAGRQTQNNPFAKKQGVRAMAG
jgi:hypothetical protein